MTAADAKRYSASQNLLEDRVILITGASAGIGEGLALAVAELGARLILHGRNRRKLEALYDALVSGGHAAPMLTRMDLAKAQAPDFDHLAKEIDGEFGRLDGLVHNAGVLGTLAPIEHTAVADWAQVLHVNLTIPFVMTQVLLPLLKRSDDASVIFTSSGVGRRGRAFWGSYAVSKFGIEGLAQVLADEVPDDGSLRVNCINPGGTRTSMRATAFPAEDPLTLKTPAEIMPAYLYLLGPDSRGVNGASIDAQ